MMFEKISIIVIAYNSAKTLAKCLNSCTHQSYENIEIVVVNDGSTDNTYEIAKSFQDKDSRIQLINKQNEGIPRTRRVGFEHSTGEYIYHLDADDYLKTDAIEILIKTIHTEEADIVIGGLVFEKMSGEKITNWECNLSSKNKIEYLKDIFESKIPPFLFGRLIKREIFDPVLVPSIYNCGEDIISNVMMICCNNNLKIVSNPSIVQHYLIYKTSLTNSSPADSFMAYTDTIEENLIKYDLEKYVMTEWSYFRIIKGWRYYLRKGGKSYLKDKHYVNNIYHKYYNVIKKDLTLIEQFELNLYRYNQFLGYQFSRIYGKYLKVINHSN